MGDYLYADDGKIHTRYSELSGCTPGQIDRVVDERMGLVKRYESEDMRWGQDRHDMWEEEARRSGRLPECFGLSWAVHMIEKELASDILPGVVLHSRLDAYCAAELAVIDYKTMLADSLQDGIKKAHETYGGSRQLTIYAYQLGLHGMTVRHAVYLVEIWNRERTEILGYTQVNREITFAKIGAVLPWIKDRVALLVSTIEARAEVLA